MAVRTCGGRVSFPAGVLQLLGDRFPESARMGGRAQNHLAARDFFTGAAVAGLGIGFAGAAGGGFGGRDAAGLLADAGQRTGAAGMDVSRPQ